MAKLKHKAHPELEFERKNRDLQKLPKYARVETRPIPHAPAATPYAGAKVPKIVYVSTKTSFMSVVKRVQKLLREAEKRAMNKVDFHNGKITEKEKIAQLKEGAQSLQKEEVFIKATGRAIQKAMELGKWFSEKDGYNINVKTGTVMVVDDIVEDDEMKEREQKKKAKLEEPKDTVTDKDKMEIESLTENPQTTSETPADAQQEQKQPQKKKNKRKRTNDDDELPESRTRWVNMVEIAVTLK